MLRHIVAEPGAAAEGRPAVGERRPGRPAAAPPLTPSNLLDLQRTAGNHAVGRLLQRIKGGQKSFAGSRVKHFDGRVGTIETVKNNNSYWVKFEGEERVGVPANQLSFFEGPTAASSESEAKEEPVPGDGRASSSQPSANEDVEADEAYRPAKLRAGLVAGTRNQWNLTLLTADGVEVGTLTVPAGNAKQYFNKTFLQGKLQGQVKEGTWDLVSQDLPNGDLRNAHLKKVRELRSGSRAERIFKQIQATHESASSGSTDGGGFPPAPSQDKVFKRLTDLGDTMPARGESGHPSVRMIKIPLVVPLSFSVGGVNRSVTHLYAQPGNEMEMRCYAGNAEGAYQRVHTSITNDGEKTSHTMVQTGRKVAVPGMRDAHGAKRIGFDSREGTGPGFGNRSLGPRSRQQTTVTSKSNVGSIVGLAHDEVPRDQLTASMLLATRFNKLLDLALADICFGELEARAAVTQGITADFKVLDDDWEKEPGETKPMPEGPEEKSKAPPEKENVAPLLAPMVSSDKMMDRSVDAFPGVEKVKDQFTLTYISGDHWLCFVRCILVHLGKSPDTMVAVHSELVSMGHEKGLTGVADVGVDTGSQLAQDILTAIETITSVQVSITLIQPQQDGAPPLVSPNSVGKGNEEVHLLHTGAHFTLATRKK